jgi:hypothetical protein
LSSDGDCTFPSLPYCSSSFSLAARRRRRCRGRPSSLLGGGTVPLLPPRPLANGPPPPPFCPSARGSQRCRCACSSTVGRPPLLQYLTDLYPLLKRTF